MAGELEIILIPAIVSAVVSFLVLSFSMKRDGLSKEIDRERKLLEEAYGPFKGKLGRMGALDYPKILVINPEVMEAIIDIRDRFEYEFSNEIRKTTDYLITETDVKTYLVKVQDLSIDTGKSMFRKTKIRLEDYSKFHKKEVTNGKEFKAYLLGLVETKFDELDKSHKRILGIQKSLFKFIIWSIIGYKLWFSLDHS